jgi:hypothetical protein
MAVEEIPKREVPGPRREPDIELPPQSPLEVPHHEPDKVKLPGSDPSPAHPHEVPGPPGTEVPTRPHPHD